MKESQAQALAKFISEVRTLAADTHEAEDRPIYQMYLSHAAVILAKVIQEHAVGDDISAMERIFGNTWLKDASSYEKAYSAWDRFKGLVTQSIHGMTVNERLYTLGLLEEFDKATAKRDEKAVRAVLFKCFLTEENIQAIIDQKLNG